ncbi:hypothetical protein CK203_041208 [Vitis vinifera]|uniref:Uncharacterized protein n=1 Tax=Vitis vinifera TaxID=29760 RepID=A0A438HT56_VITVI|nr:hypothetical protein CK203_041208 [Vitis vinifera]
MVHKLNKKNYLESAQFLKLAIERRGKLGHLTSEVTKPTTNDLFLKKWQSESSLVIAWFINSMELAIGKPYLFLPTTKYFWANVTLPLLQRDSDFMLGNGFWVGNHYPLFAKFSLKLGVRSPR